MLHIDAGIELIKTGCIIIDNHYTNELLNLRVNRTKNVYYYSIVSCTTGYSEGSFTLEMT